MLNSSAGYRALRPSLRKLGLAVFIAIALTSRIALGDALQDADKLLKAGDYRQALERVDKILASHPNDPQARFLKGVILTEQGDDKDAVTVFRKLTRDYPELPEPYNNLAVIYAARGEYEKAREALEQSIRTHPSYATAYENLGDVYATLAGRAYDKALQIDSTNSNAQHKLALMRELIGGPPGSIGAAQRPAVAPASQALAKATPESARQPAAPTGTAAEPEKASAPPLPKPAKPAPAEATAAVAEAAPPAQAHAAGSATSERAILALVENWAKAWSRQDADAYLAFYARDFDTPRGQSRAAWEKLRRERVRAPKDISVTIASPEVRVAANGSATVTFRQTYRSNFVHSTTTKTLVLERSGERWLIREERVQR